MKGFTLEEASLGAYSSFAVAILILFPRASSCKPLD